MRHLSAGMPPKDAMEVEEEGKVLPKIKADDDPDNEGAYMRLSLLRFRLTRCGVPRAAARPSSSSSSSSSSSWGPPRPGFELALP